MRGRLRLRVETGTAAGPASALPGETLTWRGQSFLKLSGPADLQSATEPMFVAQPVAGRYQVGGVLAWGEGSALLQAMDLHTRQRVLLKTTRVDTLVAGPVDRETFTLELRRARHHLQMERRLLVRLHNRGCAAVPHPNDYVYDVNPALASDGPCEGRLVPRPPVDEVLVATEPYLVLEYLAGCTLEEMLTDSRFRGMPEAEAIRLLLPVLEPLAILHEPWRLASGRTWHCVYQDFKPANILIDPLGRPVLLDFGGCQVVVDGVQALQGSFTPGYAAPECADPGRVLLPCADVYSVGATLYRLLTGIEPRPRLPDQVSSPPDLGMLPRSCSPAMRRTLERCLAPRPSERYADAGQLARALSALLADDEPLRGTRNLTAKP